jgi:hypothetical protein
MDILTLVNTFAQSVSDFFAVFGYILSQIGKLFVNLLRPINFIFILIKNMITGLGQAGTVDIDATYTFTSEIKNFITAIPGWSAIRLVLISIIYISLAIAIFKKAHNVFT